MTNNTKGWVYFLAALGMMLGLVAIDVAKLSSWYDATAPSFVANCLGHIGAVIAAFVGGKLIPSERE